MEGLLLILLAGVVFVIVGAIKGMLARSHALALERRLHELEREVKEWRRRAEMAEHRAAHAAASTAQPAAATTAPAAVTASLPAGPSTADPPDEPVLPSDRRPTAPLEPPPPLPLPPPPAPPAPASPLPAAPLADVAELTPPAAPQPAAEPLAPTRREDHLAAVERQLGSRWLTWLGIGLLFLGVAFFLKYAYDRDWLGRLFGPRARILTATGVAFVLLTTGWRSRRNGLSALGNCLLGGGQALLYLTIFAALEPAALVVPTPLLGPTTAFVLMTAVTTLGLTLAVRLDAAPMAVIALLGGFATPVLIDTGRDARDALCSYLLLLDLGVLAVALHRQWRTLDLLAFAGTAALFGGWYARWQHLHPQPDATLLWLAAFHLLFALLPFAVHWRRGTTVTGERVALAMANVTWTLGMATWLLREPARPLLAGTSLGAAALQVALGALTVRRIPDDRRARDAFFAIAALLVALGLFFLLPGDFVATAWFGEACALAWLGRRFLHAATRWLAHGVFAAAALRTIVVTLPAADAGAALAGNAWFVTLAIAGLGIVGFGQVQGALRRGFGIAAGWWFALIGTLELLRHADGHPAAWSLPVAAAAAWWLALVAVVFVLAARRWPDRNTSLAGNLPLAAAAVAAAITYVDYPANAWPVLNPCCLTGLVVLAVPTLRAWLAATTLRDQMLVVLQLGVTVLATTETAAFLQRDTGVATTSTLLQALGWVWLALAAAGHALAALRCSRLLLSLAALPLLLAIGAAFLQFDQRLEPHRLLANARFAFGVATSLALALLRPTLRRLGLGPLGDAASSVAFVVMLVLGALEALAWTAAPPHADWRVWSLAAVATIAAAAGAARAQATANRELRHAAFAALTAALPLALAVYLSTWRSELMFANLRTLLVAGAVATAAWQARQAPARPGLGRAAFVTALLGVTLEPPTWLLAHVDDAAEARRAAMFSVTVTWVLVASGLLVVGFRWRQRWLRLTALGLFVGTAAKVLLFDMSGTLQLYRILAFLLVGVVMVLASWAYHRAERRLAAAAAPPPSSPPSPAASKGA